MELRDILLEYKEATLNFICEINNDGDGASYLDKREKLIDRLKEMSFDKKELIAISDELNLMEIEKRAFAILKIEKDKVKEEIRSLKKKKIANNSYGNKFGNVSFFSKEI
ncbi:MAG: hypothetical protein RR891_08605 [Clostridium sp.]|uniref:hypothetical protein n=1 Tax=Clostridium sp. TaxID=1506 RepID=UPI00305F07F0